MSLPKKILVTGASGMLGRVLCDSFFRGSQLTGISRAVRPGTTVCDLSDLAQTTALFDNLKPDIVINPAAFSDVDGCERDPKQAYGSNVLAVKHLASLCGPRGIPLIHISTDYVFDGLKRTPYTESDPVAPVNIYGLSKTFGEYYASRCQSPSAIVRTSWLFGPDNDANFVNAILARMKKEKTVSVLDDQTDAPTYVGDLGRALEKIADRLFSGKAPASEIYHFCNTGAATRLEMTQAMKEMLKLDGVEVLRADPGSVKGRLAVRPAYVVMSNVHFETVFGMKIRPWRESLKEYLLN